MRAVVSVDYFTRSGSMCGEAGAQVAPILPSQAGAQPCCEGAIACARRNCLGRVEACALLARAIQEFGVAPGCFVCRVSSEAPRPGCRQRDNGRYVGEAQATV